MKKEGILSVKDLCQISLFVALITICSWISIPFAVPVTLQVFAVFSACAYLGLSRGVLCVVAYILLGAVGVPVFSGFRGGLSHLFNYTGGFIFGLLLSAVLIGVLLRKKENKFKLIFFSMIIALLGCYTIGSLWMLMLSTDNMNFNNMPSVLLGLVPLFIIDIIKVFLAALLAVKLKKMGEKL